MAQYVFTMNRVGKIVPPKRQILKDISLSFFPGAKIGVLGLNGSGKSTLLKIMAGIDKDIEGEAVAMPDLKIGYLPQEPQLDPDQTVREAVEQGIGGVLAAKLAAKYPGRVTGMLLLPGQAGDYAPIPDDVPEALARALRSRGVDRAVAGEVRRLVVLADEGADRDGDLDAGADGRRARLRGSGRLPGEQEVARDIGADLVEAPPVGHGVGLEPVELVAGVGVPLGVEDRRGELRRPVVDAVDEVGGCDEAELCHAVVERGHPQAPVTACGAVALVE